MLSARACATYTGSVGPGTTGAAELWVAAGFVVAHADTAIVARSAAAILLADEGVIPILCARPAGWGGQSGWVLRILKRVLARTGPASATAIHKTGAAGSASENGGGYRLCIFCLLKNTAWRTYAGPITRTYFRRVRRACLEFRATAPRCGGVVRERQRHHQLRRFGRARCGQYFWLIGASHVQRPNCKRQRQ